MTDADHLILQVANAPLLLRRARAVELGLSSPALHQRLMALLETREALEAYPALVNRHQRLQQERRERRS